MPSDERPGVLYVDDEAINLKVFEANFKNHFRVLTCPSGVNALELIKARSPEIAVVLADQRMPEMTGVQLLEKVHQLSPDTYRIMITAYSDVSAVMEAVNRGQIARYIVKPWVKEELKLAVDDALRIWNLQARLREVEARMVKSAHLIAIGQVSAGIAHELMSPVTYVFQNVGMLRHDLAGLLAYVAPFLKEKPDTKVSQTLEDLPHILEDLDQGVKHIRQVALGVKAQARGVDVEEKCELKEIVEFAVKLSRVEVGQRARVTTEGPPLQVKVGPVSLSQVLLNLIVNSAQAMEGTGRKGLIEVRWSEAPGEVVLLKVVDNGTGIPPELQEKVFEPLFTTKPAGVGTGLGLPICKELIENAGGKIRLESKVGEGTTLELTLPRP